MQAAMCAPLAAPQAQRAATSRAASAAAAAAAAPSGASRPTAVLPRVRSPPALAVTGRDASGSRHHLQEWRRVWQQRCGAPSVCCTAAASGGGSSGADPQPATPLPAALVLSSSDDEPVPPYSADASSSASASSSSSAASATTSYASGGEESGGEGGGSGGGGGGGVQIDLQLPRRSLLVQFTCNICGNRSERLVNPVAWQRGMVIAQCQHCPSWHKLADAANLVEEIRYADLEDE